MVDRVGQVLGGRYRLIAPIGTGASASVFLGDDVTLRRRVAVKVLHAALADDEAFLRRFRAEAQAAAALNHPHVMAVYDWGNDDDVPYLVTEFLGGGSLRGMLDRVGTLTPSQALLVGLETARGLEYAQKRGFVHRDIKPANLLFDDEARLRIADFGLARALAEAAWTEPMGAVLGTARYASPEQARGESLDGRSDVYSLSLVLIEAVAGSVPFATDTTLGTLMARVSKPLEVPESLGPLVPALVAAGVPDPADRPDAARFAALLMGAAEHLDRPAPLPLAGVRSLEGLDGLDRDPTTIAADDSPSEVPESVAGAAIAGAAAGAAAAGGRWSREPAPSGAEADPPVPWVDAEPSAELDVPSWVRADSEPTTGADPLVLPAAGEGLVVAGTVDHDAPTSRRARRRAAKAGALAALPVEEDDDYGEVPRSGRFAFVLVVLLLLGGAAFAGWYFGVRIPSHEVPSVVGSSIEEAAAVAAGNEWTISRTDAFDDVVPTGIVLSQEPIPGTDLAEGQVLSVVVSSGLPPVAVPTDLVGLSSADATARLEAVGLGLGEITRRYDENAANDVVLALADGTLAEVLKGDKVGIVVSDGPEPRTIPDGMVGQPSGAVKAELESMGLVVTAGEDFSETIEAGNVISLSPAAGGQIAKGGEVTMVVSKGPPVVVIPDVAGKSAEEAAAALEAVGLVVSSTDGSPTNPAVGTDPPSGTTVRKGSSVVLKTGEPAG